MGGNAKECLDMDLHEKQQRFAADEPASSCVYPALDVQTRSHVETACAAYYLMRRPQTLRAWACHENGPLRPTRVNGRLAWPVDQIRVLLNGGRNGRQP